MDALCLFDPATNRVVGVNDSWSSLFGRSQAIALGMKVHELAVSPAELAAKLPTNGSQRDESSGRCLWRRADGSQFFADFSVKMHAVGAAVFACMVVEVPAPVSGSVRTQLELVGDEMVSQTNLPVHLRAAMRERLARCTRQQAALLQLASADDKDFDGLMRQVVRVDGETLDCARVSYWTIRRGGESIYCEALYDRSKGEFESGLELFAKDFPLYFRALVTGALIPAHDAITDPRTSEFAESYLRPLGIGAMLDIPVFRRGELVGVVCHEHVGGPRGWTMDEQQFALSIGQMFALTLAARHREEAANSLQQRETMLAEANAVIEKNLRPRDGQLTGRVMGRYHFEQIVGRGGMGEVYKAKRKDDESSVAVKVLRDSSLGKPEHLQRFFREARVMTSIPSEHIAQIFEMGTFDGKLPFIAMELLEGHDLAWHLRRSPQLALDQVVELCDHTSKALAALREAGVVHRDMKPSNLFLVDAIPRAWKLLDFGLSHSHDDAYTTKAESIAGTPPFMAPEQLCGDETDHRTDIYGLAAIAFRALTGRTPFVGDLESLVHAALTEPAPRITSLVRGIPVEVDLVFAIALAKDPDERFRVVEAFADAFRAAAQSKLDDATRSHGWKLMKRSASSG
jgi:tRNA A-37 threonylcarbamoyl transferase component Bud32